MISWSSSRTTRQIGKHYKVMFVGPIIIDHACHHGQLQQYFKSDFAHKHLSREGLVSLQSIAMLLLKFLFHSFCYRKWQFVCATFLSTHSLFDSKGIEISEQMSYSHIKFEIIFIPQVPESAASDKVCLIFQFHYPRLVPRCSE